MEQVNALRETLPDVARDIRLNLQAVLHLVRLVMPGMVDKFRRLRRGR